jgi:hypothetical protein
MNTPLELRRTARGQPVLVLFGAVLAADSLSAPSVVALKRLRVGTHVLFQKQKFRIKASLAFGTHRPEGGISLELVR